MSEVLKNGFVEVGDLVRCTWQPKTESYSKETGCVPMEHIILEELGIIVSQKILIDHHTIMFTRIGYKHTLSSSAFEVVSVL
jgi:hypothetical protein